MPTERFLKLKEEKKKRILDAAFREFARVSFREGSINRIIKDAGISRGSFYTYFEDKTDLLRVIMKDGGQCLTDFMYAELEAVKGDYFLALEGTFRWFKTELAREDNLAIRFLRNTLFNEEIFLNATGFNAVGKNEAGPEENAVYQEFLRFCEETCSRLDQKHYPVTPEQMSSLFPMSMIEVIKSAAICAEKPKAEPYVRRQMEITLGILKNGVYKN